MERRGLGEMEGDREGGRKEWRDGDKERGRNQLEAKEGREGRVKEEGRRREVN